MGVDEDKILIVEEIIKNFKGPIIIDADGINCLSLKPDILSGHQNPIIITPHPGELARLAKKNVKEIQDNRIYYSNYISGQYNIIVVLKGFNTIVASDFKLTASGSAFLFMKSISPVLKCATTYHLYKHAYNLVKFHRSVPLCHRFDQTPILYHTKSIPYHLDHHGQS